MRFVFSVLIAVCTQSAFALTLDSGDEDRFALNSTPRVIENGAAISDTAAVNQSLRLLVEEFEGKPENPSGRDSAHLAILLKDTQNVCRKGKEISENTFNYNCTVNYRASNWNGVMKAVLLVQEGKVIQLAKAGFDGFQN